MTPNHALNRTARKRCLRVPSSLRSSAAGYRDRWALNGVGSVVSASSADLYMPIMAAACL